MADRRNQIRHTDRPQTQMRSNAKEKERKPPACLVLHGLVVVAVFQKPRLTSPAQRPPAVLHTPCVTLVTLTHVSALPAGTGKKPQTALAVRMDNVEYYANVDVCILERQYEAVVEISRTALEKCTHTYDDT